MKIAVLGAGLMGKEAARDLVNSQQVENVVLADLNVKKAEQVCQELQSKKLSHAFVDASDSKSLDAFIKPFDVIINALYYSFNVHVAMAAIRMGVHAVDLGGHIGKITDHILNLHSEAKKAGITYIPDLGVAPGMINILSGYGASMLDQVDSIYLAVGGIPLRPEPPLEYNHVFSLEGLLDHYTDLSTIIRDGKKMHVRSLSEIEPITFEGFGNLEAFHTAGGTSTLAYTFPHLKNLEYKTIRYKGHAEKFQLLVDLNMTRNDFDIEIDGVKVKPRDLLLALLEPILKLDDKDDVVLLKIKVEGLKDGQPIAHHFKMETLKDRTQNVTAMARCTANTISVVAQMIGNGTISKKGVFPPEQIVPGDLYVKEMAKRGVAIKHTPNML
ncbi:saccharopine dehydrogenase [Pueribacillus theae]|uniref:Saccharopine dehydrogenase n=1 Tax=Pueribacillus theae TaxID=2171751 RepID=A0A2U1K5M5_9BACI|nr:saccharopine dehydrogenase C-terminal domain-containing protein [Pueribacillus theae]PWA12682.1 saccharopine dehydrogenase [Pueribacillus theae]